MLAHRQETGEAGGAGVAGVDASAAAASPVITRLVEDAGSSAASHHLSPAALLAILGKLYGVKMEGWLVQTPAEDFGHGEGLSEMAQRGVDEAPAVAANLHRLMTT